VEVSNKQLEWTYFSAK